MDTRRFVAVVIALGLAACGGGGAPPAAASGAAPVPPAVRPPSTAIHAIQGAGHVSPLDGEVLERVDGVVTAVLRDGFFVAEPVADRDDDVATSEGVFVYTAKPPGVAVGDEVEVLGPEVSEFGFEELTTTELVRAEVRVLSSGHALPPALRIGASGRRPPGEVIDDDGLLRFEPDSDGIDFWESLEGMRVVLPNPVAVGCTNYYGETPVVAGDGSAGPRSGSGGVVVGPGDFNPERILLDDAIVPDEPKLRTGDGFDGDVVGIVDYSFGNYKLLNTTPLPPVLDGGLAVATTTIPRAPNHLTVATLNVLNLDPGDFRAGHAHGPGVAEILVRRLQAPDVVVLQEVQDDSGTRNDGTVSASETLARLVDAVVSLGGPAYEHLDVPPLDNADGGAPGSNIRVAILYDRGRVDLVERPPPSGDPGVHGVEVVNRGRGPELSSNPGRVEPGDPAWSDPEPSRRPLAAEFRFRGRRFFVVGCHLKSRREDDPLFGAVQPPRRPTEGQRIAQGRVVNRFVRGILALDPDARIVVAGDMNTFDFGPELAALAGSELVNLVARIPSFDRYTYVYDGNSQCLDHLLVSPALRSGEVEIVHVAAEFPLAGRATDHDPVIARFRFD